MTAVLPKAGDYPSFAPSFPEWAIIEKVLGEDIDPRWRGRICECVNNYITQIYFHEERVAKSKMLGVVRPDNTVKHSDRVLEMLRDMDALVRSWAIASREASLLFTRYDVTVARSQNGLNDMMGDLQYHRIALRNFLRPMPSTSKHTPFEKLVHQLGGIYRGITGDKPTASLTISKAEATRPTSLFVCLVRAIDQLLAEAAKRPGINTDAAWVASVRRALKKQDK